MAIDVIVSFNNWFILNKLIVLLLDFISGVFSVEFKIIQDFQILEVPIILSCMFLRISFLICFIVRWGKHFLQLFVALYLFFAYKVYFIQ